MPIIAISGVSNPLYLRAAGKLGATGLLEKPFSPDQLLSLIEGLLDG
jgi:CheY-like chemotaxis protein